MTTDSTFLPLLVILVYLGAAYALAWMLWYFISQFKDELKHLLFRARFLLRYIPIDQRRARQIWEKAHHSINPQLTQPRFWIEFAKTAFIIILLGMLVLGLLLQ